jgi:hypothetical protein
MRKLITFIVGLLLIVLLAHCRGSRYIPDRPDDSTALTTKISLPPINIKFDWKISKPLRDTIYFEKEGVKVTVYKWRDSIRSDIHVPKRDTLIKYYKVTKYLKPKPPPPCKKNKIRWWHLIIVAFTAGGLVKLFGK